MSLVCAENYEVAHNADHLMSTLKLLLPVAPHSDANIQPGDIANGGWLLLHYHNEMSHAKTANYVH